MNFSKDYIELCKNPKVQGLKYIFDEGDWYLSGENNNPKISRYNGQIWNHHTWLPTSDQLDEIILNICKKKFNGYFQYEMCFITTEWYGTIRYWKKSKEYMKDDELMRYAIKIDENPLICKIKLLISILEGE